MNYLCGMISRVFLVGFMGCGKTTIGRFIARDMGWQFIDMDDFFEQKHQCTINEYFAQYGENGFRDAEHQVITELCKVEHAIIATGGGAPCFFNNMELMRHSGATIYINVAPEQLTERLIKNSSSRPLLAGKSADEMLIYVKQKLNERETFYRQAHMIVDGENVPFSSYKMFITMFPNDILKD